MNSKNSKTSTPHILILKLTDKLDLRRGEKSTASPNRAHTITVNLKCQLQHGMINLNYSMDHTLYQTFRLS